MEKSILNSGIKSSGRIDNFLSDSHRYKTDKGEISMLHPCYATFNTYEIFCIEGNLFDDVERYGTIEEAEKRIKELLE